MLKHNAVSNSMTMLLAGILACSILVFSAWGQSPTPAGQPTVSYSPNHYRPERFPKKEKNYYGFLWGVDSFAVRWTESGELIRFTYRVLDAGKAKPLNDKTSQPVLIDPQAGVQLVVPTVDKIGQLRQTNQPETGKSYWMAFSNKGRLVKRGDRVTVAIGSFRVDGLEVQ